MSYKITLRAVARGAGGLVVQVIEQTIPATEHDLSLFLRRYPFRHIAQVVLAGGSVTLEVRQNSS